MALLKLERTKALKDLVLALLFMTKGRKERNDYLRLRIALMIRHLDVGTGRPWFRNEDRLFRSVATIVLYSVWNGASLLYSIACLSASAFRFGKNSA